MNNTEIKGFIAEKVAGGFSLSQIQDLLNQENVKLTFMELRLIASEIESDVFKAREKSSVTENNPPAAEESQPENGETAGYPGTEETVDSVDSVNPASVPEDNSGESSVVRGKTSVTVSPIQRPGFHATGTVSFGSGVTAEWFLDQTGRLGLDNVNGGKPDQQDIIEFQEELKKAFGV